MNKTSMQGKWRQVRGGLKTRWAKLTDDDMRLLEGKSDQMIGLFQERYGYTQERAAKALTHYLSGYGKRRRRQHAAGVARKWLSAIGLISLVTAGGFALARFVSSRCAAPEAADEELYASREAQFD
jgi:uncharacterized protein YjbJ (UPF0337 family)